MFKKIILGLGIFSLFTGTVFAVEFQDLTPRAEKQSQYMKGSRLNSCLSEGKTRVECIEKIKMERRKNIKQVREKKEELRKEIKEVRKSGMEERHALNSELRKKIKEAETTEEKQEIRKDFKEKRDEIKEEVRNNLEELKAKRKAFLEKRLNNVIRKYEAYQKRAHSISERIDYNIEKLSKNGKNVEELKQKQEKLKELLKVVDQKINKIKVGVERLVNTNLENKEDVKKSLKVIRADFKEAKREMKGYFSGLRDIIKDLKKNKE